jgi:hypothetical protein
MLFQDETGFFCQLRPLLGIAAPGPNGARILHGLSALSVVRVLIQAQDNYKWHMVYIRSYFQYLVQKEDLHNNPNPTDYTVRLAYSNHTLSQEENLQVGYRRSDGRTGIRPLRGLHNVGTLGPDLLEV